MTRKDVEPVEGRMNHRVTFRYRSKNCWYGQCSCGDWTGWSKSLEKLMGRAINLHIKKDDPCHKECVKVHRGWWGTSHGGHAVCIGCSRRLDSLGITWVLGYSTASGVESLVECLVSDIEDLSKGNFYDEDGKLKPLQMPGWVP
jgi:hypothetical protein